MEHNLNIVTYNIQNSSKAEEIKQNILALAAKGAGLFCLQEVRKYEHKEFIVDALLKLLGPSWKAEYLISPQSFDLGLCTLWDSSKLQALSFEKLLLPRLPKLKLHEKIFVKVRTKMEKIQNPKVLPTQRAALIGKFKFLGQPLLITNLHLDWQGGFRQRKRQLKALNDYLKSRVRAEFEVFCGDFNTLGFYRFSGRRQKKVRELLGEEFINVFHNRRTTSFPQMLDHIFVKNLTVAKSEILKFHGSDHFPLLAEIKI